MSAPNVIRIEVTAQDPDRWILALSLRVSRKLLAELPWWAYLRRRAMLVHIGKLEDELREAAARDDADALERTKALTCSECNRGDACPLHKPECGTP